MEILCVRVYPTILARLQTAGQSVRATRNVLRIWHALMKSAEILVQDRVVSVQSVLW